MVAKDLDPLQAADDVDFSLEELERQLGGRSLRGSDALRQRLASLLDVPAGDEVPGDIDPDDARLAGAIIARLEGQATATSVASWMNWALPRTTAALAELDRRLNSCGLRLLADGQGHLRFQGRARLRRRPEALSSELLARLDEPALRHALAHFVRGDRCPDRDHQALIDFGVVINPGSRNPKPHPALATAFAAAVTNVAEPSRRTAIVMIDPQATVPKRRAS
jgi:hypothetical protein